MAGAIDFSECRTVRHCCRCASCAVCGNRKHTSIHGPYYGEQPGSRSFGHDFVKSDYKTTAAWQRAQERMVRDDR